MHNGNKPNLDDLPTSTQLIKSTILAAVAAVAILVTVVLPSEYGIDPTGIGKAIGLAEMGEIKTQLSEEAEADRMLELQNGGAIDDRLSLGEDIFGFFFPAAYAQTATPEWTDQYSVTLTPGEGVEVKLVMEAGAEAGFLWVAENGAVNFDLHGDGGGENISYEKGRAVARAEGVLTAAFTGNHGWFWRNRDGQDVKVTLYVKGDYSEMKLP
ncbi:transmembrane anchor protein [Pseudorhodobacter sp. W20_MBD10_FR17]|uniref:transmembrane anchor protein n=1 Tax=Pseudorhodobacter sp. W20_MBD10_FR17 TaxID=3240266 RepID=UPI003F9A83F7